MATVAELEPHERPPDSTSYKDHFAPIREAILTHIRMKQSGVSAGLIDSQELMCQAIAEPLMTPGRQTPRKTKTTSEKMLGYTFSKKVRVPLVDTSYASFKRMYARVMVKPEDVEMQLRKLYAIATLPKSQREEKLPELQSMLPIVQETLASLEHVYGEGNVLTLMVELMRQALNSVIFSTPKEAVTVRKLAGTMIQQLHHEVTTNYMTKEQLYQETLHRNILHRPEGPVDILEKMLGAELTKKYRALLTEYHQEKHLESFKKMEEGEESAYERFGKRITQEIIAPLKAEKDSPLHDVQKKPTFDHLLDVVRHVPMQLELPDIRGMSAEEKEHAQRETVALNVDRLWQKQEVQLFFDDMALMIREALTHKEEHARAKNILGLFSTVRHLLQRINLMTPEEAEAYPKMYVDLYHGALKRGDKYGSLVFDVDAYHTIKGIRPTEAEPTLFKDEMEKAMEAHEEDVAAGKARGEFTISHEQYLLKRLLHCVVEERVCNHYYWLAQLPVETGDAVTLAEAA